MKNRTLFVIAMFLLLAACNINSIPVNSLLGLSNIETQSYSIDITVDNTIVGAKGSIITIPAGAIQSDEKQLDIKVVEAFSIEDIVKAGLTTASNGTPLSSGGMIYINSVQQASVVKPIDVALPADYYRKGMELFKGQFDNSGNINWQSPVPINDSPLTRLDSGRMVYERNCSSCHRLLDDATGPALAVAALEREKSWFHRFTHNSAEMIAEGDPLANASYCYWNRTAMTAFPNFSHEEEDQLHEFLINVAKENNLQDRKRNCYDSCMDYAIKKQLLQRRKELVYENGPVEPPRYMTPQVSDSIMRSGIANVAGTIFPDNRVEVNNGDVGYYSFTINAFGWYNVDVFTKDIPGFEESELSVRLIGTYDMQLHMYLVIPNDKVFVSGGLLQGSKDTYGFYTDDGKIVLPQSKQAYILGMGELEGNIVYGKTSFITSISQNLEISLEKISKEEFATAIASFNSNGLNISVDSSENAEQIGEIDNKLKEINAYKPVNCDCDCDNDYIILEDTASFSWN